MLQQLERLIAVSSVHLLMWRRHSNPGYLQMEVRVHPWITKQHGRRAAVQLAAAAGGASASEGDIVVSTMKSPNDA